MCKYDFIFGCVNDLFGFSMRESGIEREREREGDRQKEPLLNGWLDHIRRRSNSSSFPNVRNSIRSVHR